MVATVKLGNWGERAGGASRRSLQTLLFQYHKDTLITIMNLKKFYLKRKAVRN